MAGIVRARLDLTLTAGRTRMRPMLPPRLAIVPCLTVAVLLTGAACRPAPFERTSPTPAASAAPNETRAPAASAPTGAAGLDEIALAGLADAALAAQVRRVVESMDATGRPPAGVAQGGRRRGRRGEFQNAEGRLPRRSPGHYEESDVWPPGPRGRGGQRLVFGREREVYFSGDHYRSFVRLR
jgi:guanyl-specific ribonuclease Sa